MMSNLSLFINDQLVTEYDRSTELDEKQREFLDKMDTDMDRGVKISGELISAPDSKQRATFVVMNLLNALQQDDDARVALYCAYLTSRLPHALEVRASAQGDGIAIEFIEEH